MTEKKKPITKKKPKTKAEAIEPKTVAEAKKLEEKNDYWQLTDDEVLLRSPNPEDEYKTSDSWRVFRIMGEFVNGFDSMATITRGVSIFGSARTAEDSEYYIAARETARLLAEAGFEIITGGGPGIMEAANRGASDAKKVSVGCN
ncbi:MAG: TIGR00730 family Rossman fold protein, partial [Acidobacteriota bacterium]|nr:TIGR00730 family Rossman fold protein [Acidobacteriota bacterium]